MCKLAVATLLLGCLASGYGFLFGKGPEYDDLRVTFAINPLNLWRYNPMPRTLTDAVARGWSLHKDGCSKNKNSLPGQRYILNGDISVILVFDANGYIAGLQMGIPKTAVTPGHSVLANPIIDDDQNYVLSTYFVNPARICDKTQSRTQEEFHAVGTATQIFWQVGPNVATDVMDIPLTQDEKALSQAHWTKGKCMPTMGMHYWYNITNDLDCDKLMPYCLLYNGGKFNGFCYAMPTEFHNENQWRFEHPTGNTAKQCCMTPYPKCFDDTGLTHSKLTTLHVFLDSTPLLNFC